MADGPDEIAEQPALVGVIERFGVCPHCSHYEEERRGGPILSRSTASAFRLKPDATSSGRVKYHPAATVVFGPDFQRGYPSCHRSECECPWFVPWHAWR